MVLGRKVARAVGVVVRAVAERGEVKWVLIKCMWLRFLVVFSLKWLGFQVIKK